MSKSRLTYITVASLIVIATIFASVHASAVKNAYSHALTIVSRRHPQEFLEQLAGRRPKDANHVSLTFDDKGSKSQRRRTDDPDTITSDDWMLSSMPTRAPPELSPS